ncbi:hypothetical protein R6242_21550 [Iodobacter sp. CM08]|uniref:hypothetical protein n=1 Tax=Iodobacter sp. CM08 TaxID=3085902 RepID=UPI0029816422|nr:hypothetical protein [Iodobacter sp. CM08]MDW5419163.1 hypothetical protein [Iodobacter sp. CM08]
MKVSVKHQRHANVHLNPEKSGKYLAVFSSIFTTLKFLMSHQFFPDIDGANIVVFFEKNGVKAKIIQEIIINQTDAYSINSILYHQYTSQFYASGSELQRNNGTN